MTIGIIVLISLCNFIFGLVVGYFWGAGDGFREGLVESQETYEPTEYDDLLKQVEKDIE